MKKRYLDQALSIDVNFLNRNHALVDGVSYSMNWGETDDLVGSISIDVKGSNLEILCSKKIDSGYGAVVDYSVEITYSRCNYGSKRPWLLCPDCGARVAKLYYLEAGFICRKCSGLAYETQSESVRDRSLRKAIKIRRKLGSVSGLFHPIPMPPKGMSLRKFDDLKKELQDAECRYFLS